MSRKSRERKSNGQPGPAESKTAGSSYLEQFPLLMALGINLFLFLLTYLLLTPRFQYNDDPMMMLLAAGAGRTIEPSMYLNFSHVIVGWVLKQLYSITINLPWYTLYLIFGLFAAHATYLYLILKRTPCYISVILYLAYFYLVGVNLLLNLQFSISSILAGSAGFLLLLAEVRENEFSEDKGLKGLVSARSVVGLVLVVFSSLIRFQGALFACIIAMPFFILLLRPPFFRTILPRVILTAVALTLCFGFFSLQKMVYSRNPDTQDFLSRNSLEIQFLDNSVEERVDENTMARIVDEAGWSINDFMIFRTWFAMDEERYSMDTFKTMLSKLPGRNVQLTWQDITADLKKIWDDPFVQISIVCTLFMLVFLAFHRQNGSTVAAFVCLVPTLILAFIVFVKTPPPRLYFPLFGYLAVMPLILLRSDQLVKITKFSPVRITLGIFLLILVLIEGASATSSYQEQSSHNFKTQKWYQSKIEELAPRRDQLYISWTGAFGWQWMSPFRNISYVRNLIAPDSRRYPATLAALRHFHIDDPYLALVRNENVFLVIHSGQAKFKLGLFAQYMREHYNLQVHQRRLLANQAFEVYDLSANQL